MSKDLIGYDALVDSALRGAVRQALKVVSERGLLGNHHLYISFRTGHAGVEIPDFLRERYPDEMTIVLQHQYWGLEAEEDAFSVTLSFNKARCTLTVPYAAITRFADPGVKFGLQFTGPETGAKGVGPATTTALVPPAAGEALPSESKSESKKAEPKPATVAKGEDPLEVPSKVIRLDTIRRK